MRGTVGPILPKPLCIRIVMANVLIWIVMMMMMMTTTDTCLHNLTSPQRISMPRSTSGVNKVRTKIDKETKKTIQRLHQTDIKHGRVEPFDHQGFQQRGGKTDLAQKLQSLNRHVHPEMFILIIHDELTSNGRQFEIWRGCSSCQGNASSHGVTNLE